MSNAPLLSVRGLTKHFGSIAAISDVSFGIRRGEILGLIGPNGAGKTTLFECMAGVLPPSAGAILVEDRGVTPRERSDLLFYLPDAIAPWPSQPVRWVLDFAVGFFGARADVLEGVIQSFALQPLVDDPI